MTATARTAAMAGRPAPGFIQARVTTATDRMRA